MGPAQASIPTPFASTTSASTLSAPHIPDTSNTTAPVTASTIPAPSTFPSLDEYRRSVDEVVVHSQHGDESSIALDVFKLERFKVSLFLCRT
jgi:hypothetical protein